MGRGIEGKKIFRNDGDRGDFLRRLGELCESGALVVYAWALMPNHFHLLVRSGNRPLGASMRKLLTGYAINFNLRYRRRGHLFQNRYKSIVCEDDPYLLELTRYIHLNALRAGLVEDLKALGGYPWTGHSAIMGKVKRPWQDTQTVLGYFGRFRKEAISRYEDFVWQGVGQGRRPELVGGGLVRSAGGWSEVLSLRHKGMRMASDERILGGGSFVERLMEEAQEREKETLRLRRQVRGLGDLAKELADAEGITLERLRSGDRTRRVSRARRLFCRTVVEGMGYPAAEVARYLGITTSGVARAAKAEQLDTASKVQ
jgi:REP element-mobilizing transposase RayT